jgi:endonuclease IV
VRFGVHMPQTGGFKKNVERVAAIGCRTIQIFPGNPTGWRMGKLENSEIESAQPCWKSMISTRW